MSRIVERYASAVRSGNLKSEPKTTYSDSDVVGAHGLAAKRHPLAVALQRMLMGDNSSARSVVEHLAQMADGKAFRLGLETTPVERLELSRAVVAYWRNGACQACHGHGYRLIEGAPYLSENLCTACRGSKRRPFDREFPVFHVELAQWMLTEIERETSKAGQAAMAALAPRMEL